MGDKQVTRISSAKALHPKRATTAAKQPLPTRVPVHPLLQLQRQIGNQAVSRLIQAKLTIGEAGDKYEQEADRVAAQVVSQINAPTPQQSSQGQTVQRQEMPQEEELQTKPEISSIQRQEMPEDEKLQTKPQISSIQRQEMPEEEELQTKPMVQRQPSGDGMAATPQLEASIQQARGGGQPLSERIRKPMEQAFGADFSGVRVHTDAQSDELNQSIQAKAFTTGQDIFFRQGEYDPENRKELLAHELTHVVQQEPQFLDKKRIQRIADEQSKQKVGQWLEGNDLSNEQASWLKLVESKYYSVRISAQAKEQEVVKYLQELGAKNWEGDLNDEILFDITIPKGMEVEKTAQGQRIQELKAAFKDPFEKDPTFFKDCVKVLDYLSDQEQVLTGLEELNKSIEKSIEKRKVDKEQFQAYLKTKEDYYKAEQKYYGNKANPYYKKENPKPEKPQKDPVYSKLLTEELLKEEEKVKFAHTKAANGTGKVPIATEYLDPDEFRKLLASGYQWKDSAVPGEHGEMTHRIQWYLISKNVITDPIFLLSFYKRFSEIKYYRDPKYGLWDAIVDRDGGQANEVPFKARGLEGASPERLTQLIKEKKDSLPQLHAIIENRLKKRAVLSTTSSSEQKQEAAKDALKDYKTKKEAKKREQVENAAKGVIYRKPEKDTEEKENLVQHKRAKENKTGDVIQRAIVTIGNGVGYEIEDAVNYLKEHETMFPGTESLINLESGNGIKIELNEPLYIISHGDKNKIGGYSPDNLVKVLIGRGLDLFKVGEVWILSCESGVKGSEEGSAPAQQFKEALKRAYQVVARGRVEGERGFKVIGVTGRSFIDELDRYRAKPEKGEDHVLEYFEHQIEEVWFVWREKAMKEEEVSVGAIMEDLQEDTETNWHELVEEPSLWKQEDTERITNMSKFLEQAKNQLEAISDTETVKKKQWVIEFYEGLKGKEYSFLTTHAKPIEETFREY